ncbi:MAG: hypothetical protein A2X80_03725 [Geobacteraceae bacterium GWB2_52_12]|nr:MAG: hypothetical protein A2X80_03725 [Geobacteraceae bacterium GWB2_52_12]
MKQQQLVQSLDRSLFAALEAGELQQAEHLATALMRMHHDQIAQHATCEPLSYLDMPCYIRDTNYRSRRYLATAIVSTYKAARFMRGRLEDLLAQSLGSRLEILVIDSASPENESDIVAEYQEISDNIRYIRTPRRETVYQAWNRGVRLAQGEFLTNANTDDRLRYDALEQLTGALLQRPDAGIAFANFHITDHENETFASHHAHTTTNRPAYSLNALLENSITGSQPVWRRILHEELGLFDIGYTSAGDYEFFIRAAHATDGIRITTPLGLVWTSPDTFSGKGKLPTLEFYAIRERYRHLLAPTGCQEIISDNEADYLEKLQNVAAMPLQIDIGASPEFLYEIGARYENVGDWGSAWRYLQRAWYLKPESERYRKAVERLLAINLLQTVRELVHESSDSNSIDTLLSIALACRMLGCMQLAALFYFKAAVACPEQIAAVVNLQQLLVMDRNGGKL